MKVKSSQSFLSVGICLILLIFVCLGCKEIPVFKDKVWEFDTETAEEAIRENPEFQEVDSICKQIPLSSDFKLKGKIRTFNAVGISNIYYSKTKFEISDKIFREYFKNNGWESVKTDTFNSTSKFRNNKYEVIIQYGGISSDANYSINCRKLKEITN